MGGNFKILILVAFCGVILVYNTNYMNFERNITKDLNVPQKEAFSNKKENLDLVKEILQENFGQEKIPKDLVLEMIGIRNQIKDNIDKENFIEELDITIDDKIKKLMLDISNSDVNKEDIKEIREIEGGGLLVVSNNGEEVILDNQEEGLLNSLRLYFDSYRLAHNANKFRSNVTDMRSKIVKDNLDGKTNFYSEKDKKEEVFVGLQEKYKEAGFSDKEIKELIKICDLQDLDDLPVHEIKIMSKIQGIFSKFMGGDKTKYIGLSAALMVPAFIQGYAPMLFADAFKDNTTDINQIILFSVASVGGAGLSTLIQKYYKDFINQNYKKEGGVSEFAAKNLTEMPPDETKKFGLETVKYRTSAGRNSYENVLNTFSFNVLPTVTTLTTSAVMLYEKSPMLAGGTILASGITIALDKYFQKVGKFWEKERGAERTSEQIAKKLDEQLNAHMEVILAGEKEKFFNEIKDFLEKEKIAQSDKHFFRVMEEAYFQFSSYINLTLVGVASLLAGGTPDKTIAAVLYSSNFNNGIQNLLSSKRNLLRSLRNIMQMELMFNGCAKEEELKEKDRIGISQTENSDIVLKDVNVEMDNKKILDSISLEIPSGSLAYLEGASGAGKTTLMKIISGYYYPNSGEVKFGGLNVKNIKKTGDDSIYNKIAYLSQFPYLFDDTLKNNLTFGLKKDIDTAEIIQTLKEVGLYERFGKNIDEKLFGGAGDSGKTSGGETSRIGLARVLLKIRNNDSKLIFLDEPTASVDKDTKKDIAEIINTEKSKRPDTTFIVISHDEKFVEMLNCNIKIKMEKGKILES